MHSQKELCFLSGIQFFFKKRIGLLGVLLWLHCCHWWNSAVKAERADRNWDCNEVRGRNQACSEEKVKLTIRITDSKQSVGIKEEDEEMENSFTLLLSVCASMQIQVNANRAGVRDSSDDLQPVNRSSTRDADNSGCSSAFQSPDCIIIPFERWRDGARHCAHWQKPRGCRQGWKYSLETSAVQRSFCQRDTRLCAQPKAD